MLIPALAHHKPAPGVLLTAQCVIILHVCSEGICQLIIITAMTAEDITYTQWGHNGTYC